MSDGTIQGDRYLHRSANRLGMSVPDFLAKRAAGEKWCARCRAWQPASAFGVDRHASDGLRSFCRQCGRVKVPSTRQSTRFRGKRHSEETRVRMRQSRSGPGNANWKGGVTPLIRKTRNKAAYQEWRRAVFTRDGHACTRCGATEELHAHHRDPVKTHPELMTDVSNGLTLCPFCHRLVHQEMADGR